jgi:glycosyltransferase involved in cell wall biosynthesis
MSYGLPVLCFNNDGPGAFSHPSSSLRVDYGWYDETIAMFAEKLKSLHANKACYEAEAAKSAARFQQYFTWPVRGAHLQSIYQEQSIGQQPDILKSIVIS